MHPAPSLIVFTVFSGLGFGLLFWLGAGLADPTGLRAFILYGLGYGLAGAGLAASAFHLGHPERALLAFTQWRSSWLSREAVLAAAALGVTAPHAVATVFLDGSVPVLREIGGLLALGTVGATAMIYAQLRTVPRWNHWTTPAVFVLAALAGGALLAGALMSGALLLAALGAALAAHWSVGDRRFRAAGSTPGTATGLSGLGRVRLLEPPHTGSNYLLREMVHVVGRRHAYKLRLIALGAASVVPAAMLLVLPGGYLVAALALVVHLAGMLAARWLFFAEAEHVVGLYYGRA